MSKKVSIGKRPGARPSAEAIDKWLEKSGGAGESAPSPVVAATPPKAAVVPPPAPKMKRLTIDIPDNLHRRVKSRCGLDGLRMADVIRDLLEQRFPTA